MKSILKASSNAKLKAKMATNLGKSLQEALAQLEAEQLLKQQTETFWLLQMQFLSMNKKDETTFNLFFGILFGRNGYKKNKHTRKVKQLMRNFWKDWTDEQFECLCTHFALQLAGVEE